MGEHNNDHYLIKLFIKAIIQMEFSMYPCQIKHS